MHKMFPFHLSKKSCSRRYFVEGRGIIKLSICIYNPRPWYIVFSNFDIDVLQWSQFLSLPSWKCIGTLSHLRIYCKTLLWMSEFGPIIRKKTVTWLSKFENSGDKSLHNNISTIHLLRDFIWKFTQLFTFIYPRYRIIFYVW